MTPTTSVPLPSRLARPPVAATRRAVSASPPMKMSRAGYAFIVVLLTVVF